MTLPTWVGAGTSAGGVGAITPTIPAAAAEGDVLLLAIESASTGAFSPPTDWVLLADGNTGSETRLEVFGKRMAAGEPDPVIADRGDHAVGIVNAFAGCIETGDFWDVISIVRVQDSNVTTTTVNGATTTTADTLVVLVSAHASQTGLTSGWVNANLANLASRSENGTSSGNTGAICVGTGEWAGPGDYGNSTAGILSSRFVSVSIALKPAVAATHELPRATEADTARALSVAKTVTLSRVTSTDVARDLVASRTYELPRASETDHARELIVSTADVHQLTRAVETDVARALTAAKTVVLPRATETDAARGLVVTFQRVYVLPRAVETDVARELGVEQVVAPAGPVVVSRRSHEPKIPKVHCRLDNRPVGLDDWLATTIANGGFDTLRGTVAERIMRRYPSSFEQGAPIRLVLDSGRIIWEGELDANPLAYDGLVELSARGPVMWAEEMEDQYLAQSRDTQLFGDEAAAPFNGSPSSTISADVIDGALHWHVARDTVLQQDDSHRLIAWVQGSLVRRLQGSIFRTGTTAGFQLRIETLSGPDGTPTSMGGYSVGAGTLVNADPNVPEDAVAVSLHFTGADNSVQPDDLDVYLRDVRIHDIAPNDSFTVTEMFADAGSKLGYDVSAIPVGPPGPRSASPAVWTTIYLVTKGLVLNEKWKPPPFGGGRNWWSSRFKAGPDIRRPIGMVYKPAIRTSPLNILPFVWGGRFGGNWAGMFNQGVEMLDWRWRIGGNHYGQGPVVDVGPWGPSHDVRVRKNATPKLSSVVLQTRVEVVYATENRGQAKVVRTRDPDPLGHRGRRARVHKFVLPDVQKDDALATQVADILLEEFSAPRMIGSVDIVGIHAEADETLYDAQGGDLVTIGDLEAETIQPLRIAQTEMSADGVTAGIGQPATVMGRLALYEANESRRPYGTIFRTSDVRTMAEAAKIRGFVPR